MNVITFGTFDLLHVGHINILESAKKYGTKLIVGVSSDKLNYEKKGQYPVYDEISRMKIIKSIGCVDDVFLEESLENKVDYIKKYSADILIMGDDWKNKFDYCIEQVPNLKIIYLPRTLGISTTLIKKKIYHAPTMYTLNVEDIP